ncbi:MAG: ammonia-forming cytochrome c nitrite reductase subunit c552, partial [Planctomycetaceae bacterium]|nr:ammonia-forming cytochrome c nitrite reductase subunit c552 [Planctomycetaceae bacterium]
CHEDFREPKKLTAHTHHLANSQGSQCYNCHMPHTTYGLLKAIRSHQIDSPNVQTSLATGRPNACNLCHLDQTLAWTAEHLGQWYGEQIPEMNESQRTVSAAVLHLLSGDAGQRALLAWALGWSPAQQVSGTDWMAPYLGQLLNDPYEAVRFIARRSLQGLPGQDVLDYDFVGPIKQRLAASQRVLQQWSGQVQSKPRAALLIDAEGRLNITLFEQLLRQRDDRPLRLAE